jgi:hypothetical protein
VPIAALSAGRYPRRRLPIGKRLDVGRQERASAQGDSLGHVDGPTDAELLAKIAPAADPLG